MSLGLSPRWEKEVRTIAPFVLAVCAIWPLAAWQDVFDLTAVVPVAAVAGAMAIGAFSIGGEYASGTLVWALSQPESRASLWIRKRVVAIAGVAIVLMVGWAAFRADTWRSSTAEQRLVAECVVSGLCAVTIAPVLAIVGRSALFSLVLTIAIAVGVWAIGDVLSYAKFGPLSFSTPEAARWTLAFVWWTSVPLCTVALVFDGLLFRRLQAIEGAPPALWTSTASARSASRPRARMLNRPWLPLVRKELRLLQVALLGPPFFVCMWLVAVISSRLGATTFANMFDAFSLGYLVLFAGLIGALAGAEEKQLGTHQGQLLMPAPVRGQFLVKLGVAFSVTAVAGVLLVCLLNQWGLPRQDGAFVGLSWPYTFGMMAITLWTFYVATFSTNSIRALVAAVPIGGVVFLLFWDVVLELLVRVQRGPHTSAIYWIQTLVRRALILQANHFRTSIAVSFALIVLTVASFAFRNHRWPDVRVPQIALQLAVITTSVGAAMLAYGLVLALLGL